MKKLLFILLLLISVSWSGGIMPYGKQPFPTGSSLYNGLVGSWLLNEGGGLKAVDGTGKNTLVGVLSGGAAYVVTPIGKSVSLASGKYVDLGTQNNLELNTLKNNILTVAAKVYPTDVVGSHCILADYDAGGSTNNWFCDINSSGKFRIVWGNATIATSNLTAIVNTSYVVVFTRSGASGAWTGSIDINGKLDVATASSSNPNNVAEPVAIGRAGAFAGDYFSGYINDLFVWNRVLTVNEKWNLYTIMIR